MNTDTISSITPRNKALDAVVATLEADYGVLNSWYKVAEKYDVSPAMAWRVANQGYEPKDPEIRKKLGFPEIIEVKVFRNKEGKFSKGKNDG